MKIATVHSILLAGVCFVTALQTSNGADDTRMYFALDGGVNFASDVDADFDFGPISLSGDAEFDTGFRFDMLGGYKINEFLGIELETGFIYNTFSGISIEGIEVEEGDSWVGHVPLLVNAIFRYENDTPWTPYAGVGAGASLSLLEIDEADTDTEFAPAWQAQLGVRYALDETSSIGVGYKYFGTTSRDFDIEDIGIELQESHNHALVVSVVFNF